MVATFIFLLGLIIGSFLNVVIIRLREHCSILGRSFCINCKKFIKWYDNIPVLSFLLLKAKCRFCKTKISWQYPLVEMITGVLFLLVYFKYARFSDYLSLAYLFRDLIFIAVLIVIFVIDFRWYLILDIVTLPAIVFALGINLFLGISWLSLLVGGVLGGGFFLAQFLVSGGRWIGGGDIRLGVLMGVMLGWKLILVALFLAYFVGAIVGISLVIFKQKKFSSKIPFGTFLSAAAVVSLLYGEEILQWYLRIVW
jgi:prepilin signal peptidase PulO-like enzyme (type II secretory pathway)